MESESRQKYQTAIAAIKLALAALESVCPDSQDGPHASPRNPGIVRDAKDALKKTLSLNPKG